MNKSKNVLLFLFLVLTLKKNVFSELICYDCDAFNAEKCISPIQSDIKTTICDEADQRNANYECFTFEYMPG